MQISLTRVNIEPTKYYVIVSRTTLEETEQRGISWTKHLKKQISLLYHIIETSMTTPVILTSTKKIIIEHGYPTGKKKLTTILNNNVQVNNRITN